MLHTPQNNKEEGARAKKLVTCGTRSPLGRGQSVPLLRRKQIAPKPRIARAPELVPSYFSLELKPCTDRLFPKMGECREVLGAKSEEFVGVAHSAEQ